MRPGDRRVLGRQLGTGGCRLFVAALLPERLGALTLDEERVEGKENDEDQVESEINVTIQNTYLPSSPDRAGDCARTGDTVPGR